MHVCPMVTPGVPPVPHVGGPIIGPGAPTVLICNMPAATLGDMCTCVGPPSTIVLGSLGVLIGGKPAARMGDLCAHGGTITMGAPTVLIGEISPGAPGAPVIAGMMSAVGKGLNALIEFLEGGLDNPLFAQSMGEMIKSVGMGAAEGANAGVLGGLGKAMAEAMQGMAQGLAPDQPGIGARVGALLGATNAMNQGADDGEPFVGRGGVDEPPTQEENTEASEVASAPEEVAPEKARDPEGDKGKAFEKAVQKTFADKTIRSNEIIRGKDGTVLTEIDVEIDEAIIQIGRSLDGKSEQLHMSAAIAKERGKMLFVVWGPATPKRRLAEMRRSLRLKWGNRVRFIYHHDPVD